MTPEMIKNLLDSCFLAKKITEAMPKLPEGLKPRHIHIITSIEEHSQNGEPVRVSDVSNDLKVTMPSITKLINELQIMGIIKKYSLPDDKRAISLLLTVLGKKYYEIYVLQYHGRLLNEFSDLDTETCNAMISSINRLYEGINKISKEEF